MTPRRTAASGSEASGTHSPARGPAPRGTAWVGLVGREDRGGSAELGAHVGDSRALRDRQGLNAVARSTQSILPTPPLTVIWRRTSRITSFAGDPRRTACRCRRDADDIFGHRDVICAAAHRDRNVQSARAEGEHADAAAGRGMAVRADQRLARRAEALQMNLMADAVAWPWNNKCRAFSATDPMYLWSSAFSKPVCRVLWSM